jgi:DNA repair protein RecO (recombination protein O)
MLPSLETCVGCGEPLDETERVPFGMISGGVLCRRCRSGHHAVVTLSGAAITMLRQLARLEGPAPMPPDLGLGALGELRGFMNNYVAHVLGYRPKTQSFLGAVDPAR